MESTERNSVSVFDAAVFLVASMGALLTANFTGTLAVILSALGVQAVCTAVLAVRKSRMWHFSLFFLFLLAVQLLPIPPALTLVKTAIALAVYFVILSAVKRLRPEREWVRLGKNGAVVWILSVLTVIVSAVALTVWYKLTRPDISKIVEPLTGLSAWVLVIGAFLFATFNSITEEFVFRGVFWEAMEASTVPHIRSGNARTVVLLIVQALFFGAVHYQGFPGGVSGILLATLYGLFLGILRQMSGGLLAAIVTHSFADLVIAIIVMRSSGLI